MNHAAKATSLRLIIALFSAIESFLLSLPVVYYLRPRPKPVSEFSGLGILGELVIAGATVTVVTFFVSFILVVKYYRSENQRTFGRLAISLLASVVTFLAAALFLGNHSFALLWAIGLSVLVLIGATTTVIRYRPLGL